jgi:hypothetical protein
VCSCVFETKSGWDGDAIDVGANSPAEMADKVSSPVLSVFESVRLRDICCVPELLLLTLVRPLEVALGVGPRPWELSDPTVGGDLEAFRLFGEDLFTAVICGWKTGTLARLARSSWPICQCIDSTALHGSSISLAIMSHISFLNLVYSLISIWSELRLLTKRSIVSK